MNTKIVGLAILAGLGIVVTVLALEKFEIISLSEKKEPTFDVDAWSMVTSYRGEDGHGESILEIMNAILDEKYVNPDVLLEGESFVEWLSYKVPSQGDNVYQVDYTIRTVLENRQYTWYVDKISGKITSGNDAAQELLDQVNNS